MGMEKRWRRAKPRGDAEAHVEKKIDLNSGGKQAEAVWWGNL
jgi:hypothetical protein